MEKEMAELCIGALLHDIGKISERAEIHLNEQSRRMQQSLCPAYESGRYGYEHSAHTNQFFETLREWLPRELEPGKIANIASSHHKPDAGDLLQLICQQGDWLSAGQDRKEAKLEDYDESSSELQQKSIGVRDFGTSIFSRLPREKGASEPQNDYYLPLVPMDLSKQAFAKKSVPSDSKSAYGELWKAMLTHFQQIQPTCPELAIEQILWIYRLYAWCVPSHRSKFQEISLMEHSFTAAAFACALYQYHLQTNTLKETAVSDWKVQKFLIVQGDLSGIQSYLYDTSLEYPSGLSRRLRAKSFYLGFVTRLAGMLLLERLGLPIVNRIIDAGGNFTLLVQNTPDAQKTIQETELQIARWFKRTFRGRLHLNLSYDLALSGEDFKHTRFYEIQKCLAERMDAAKKHSQQTLLQAGGRWNTEAFFAAPDPALGVQEEGSADEAIKDNKFPENQFFEQLGSKLANSSFLIVSKKQIDKAFDPTIAFLPLAHPLDAYFFAVSDRPQAANDTISCIEFVPGRRKKPFEVRGGAFFANYVPFQTEQDRPFYCNSYIKEQYGSYMAEAADSADGDAAIFEPGKPKSFAHLAVDALRLDKDQKPYGADLLAVLKADVDRLGMLFSVSLEKAQAPLSYYICLSNQLDLFFSGILPNLFLNPPAGHEDFRNIYTVYAGGDDLLLVGPWRTIFNFAVFFRKYFKEYVCWHSGISLSAGIAVCRSRFPLSQAAKQAGEALQKAKQNRDRICVFNSSLKWDEFEQAIEDARFLDRIMQQGGFEGIEVKKAFVYRLLRYCRMAEACHPEENKPVEFRNLIWRSHLKYDLARNVESKIKEKSEKCPGLLRLEQMTEFKKEDLKMQRLKVAAMCCLYMNR